MVLFTERVLLLNARLDHNKNNKILIQMCCHQRRLHHQPHLMHNAREFALSSRTNRLRSIALNGADERTSNACLCLRIPLQLLLLHLQQ